MGYYSSRDPQLHSAVAKRDTMAWLQADFHLTDTQLAAVRELHASYAGTCAEHCRKIQEATRARNALEAAKGDKIALDKAQAQINSMRRICESAIEAHVRSVAALMSPEDGRRYLQLVLPKIAHFDHSEAPDLRLNTSSSTHGS